MLRLRFPGVQGDTVRTLTPKKDYLSPQTPLDGGVLLYEGLLPRMRRSPVG